MAIASRQHAVVKDFRAAARGEDEAILLDGWHLIGDAIDAGIPIEVVAVVGQRLGADQAAVLARTTDSGSRLLEVTPSVMAALSPVRTPSGAAAIARRPEVTLAQLIESDLPLVIVGIDIQDPGNAGAIVRAAEAAGATGVCLAGASADAWSWKALRASMGSTFRLPVVNVADPHDAIRQLRAPGLVVVAAVARDGVPMQEVDFARPIALLVGSEGTGLTADHVRAADVRVTIPMAPPVESLNVAVAAGVLAYEARRQRNQ